MGIIKQGHDIALAKNVLDYFVNHWERPEYTLSLVIGVSGQVYCAHQRMEGFRLEEASGLGNRVVYIVGSKNLDRVHVYAGYCSTFDGKRPEESAVVSMGFSPDRFREAAELIAQLFVIGHLTEFDPEHYRLS